MKKFLSGLLVVSGLLLGATPALAARTVSSATLNAGSSVTVAPSATITANVIGQLTSNDDWLGTKWRISTTVPGTTTCADTTNYTSNGPNLNSGNFSITAPATPGTYNVYFVLNDQNNCSGNDGTTFTMTNAVIVAAPLTAQTITPTTSAPVSAVYNSTFPVAASASSTLPVAITTTGGCSGSGTGSATVTMTSGTNACVVHYNQAGNGSFSAAPEVTETTTAVKAASVTEVTCSNGTYNGLEQELCSALVTGVGGLSETPAVNYLNNINAGDNTASGSASYGGDDNYLSSNDITTFSIAKANAVIVVTPYSVTYDANAHTAVGSATGVLAESLTGLDVSATTHTDAGTYGTDAWTFTDVTGNYNNDSGTVSDSIAQTDANVSVSGYTGVYDASSHGASGTATGVSDVDLSEGLSLGASYTDVPGGTANWTFEGGNNYLDESGSVEIVISQDSSTTVITCPVSVTYTGSALTPCTANVTGANLNESVSVDYLDNTVVGIASASATFAGDTNHTGSSDSTTFEILPVTYTITVSAGPHGNISPAGPSVLVVEGEDQTFTIAEQAPNPSHTYEILDVLVDGVSQGPIATYTFENVTEAHTISATFAEVVLDDGSVTITPATGGEAISADDVGGAYTTLTGPVVDEVSNKSISTGTIVLNAPAGFEFDSSATVTVAVSRLDAGSNALLTLTSGNAVVTSSTITINVATQDAPNGPTKAVSRLTYSGIAVRPTSALPLATGNITNNGTAVDTGSTNFGTLTEVAGTPVDTTIPVIALAGDAVVNLVVGDDYTDAGATASDDTDGDLTEEIVVGGDTVDTGIPDTYVITYNVSDAAGNDAAEVTRTVNVSDEDAPVINVIANVTVEATSPSGAGVYYDESLLMATDDVDGPITVNSGSCTPVSGSTLSLGTHPVSCGATDSSDNTGTGVAFNFIVKDTISPVINLNGDDTVNLIVGGTYFEAGATASDDVDTSVAVIVGGDVVNINIPNTYVVTYNAMDDSGNSATQVTRTVNVEEGGDEDHGGDKDTTVPVITLLGVENMNVKLGDAYVDAGATALDGDVDLTSSIVTVSTVNTEERGVYKVTYNVSDGTNNAVPVVRTVKVVGAGVGVVSGGSPGQVLGAAIGPVGEVLGAEKFMFTLYQKMGSKGNEVMELQKFLNNAGFGTLVVDGKFGQATKAALIKFQLANSLAGDGIVGPLTRAVLNK